MWFVGGDKDVSTAVEQLEKDSDRAAALIAAAIVEIRLEQAIKQRLRPSDDLLQKLFKPSGPLGPFSVKIDLAFLLGLLSPDAHTDLVNIKNIRNDFAHRLDISDFSTPTVRDRCFNFKLPDKHVGYISKEELESRMNRSSDEVLADLRANEAAVLRGERAQIFWRTTEANKDLCDPRKRYIITAQVLNEALGSDRLTWPRGAPKREGELI